MVIFKNDLKQPSFGIKDTLLSVSIEELSQFLNRGVWDNLNIWLYSTMRGLWGYYISTSLSSLCAEKNVHEVEKLTCHFSTSTIYREMLLISLII